MMINSQLEPGTIQKEQLGGRGKEKQNEEESNFVAIDWKPLNMKVLVHVVDCL